MTMHRLALAGISAMALVAATPVQARPLSDEEAQILREEMARLRSRVDELERRLADAAAAPAQAAATPAAPPAQAAATPAPAAAAPAAPPLNVEWKGGPRIVVGDRAFKVKGRIQADAAYIAAPASSTDRGLGFSNEFRRIRLGGEGELGSGFGYKLELELSDNAVDLVDTFVTYRKGPWLLALGNQNQFQSLDELTSDTLGSVMERAAFTDAFNFERRMGLSVQYRKGPFIAQGGIFTDDITALSNSSDGVNGGDENNSFALDGRLVYAPKLGSTQLHFGASAHWRNLGRLQDSSVRYRQRPFFHSTNTRLLDTGPLKVDKEFSNGFEVAAIRGRWHAVGEAHWLHPTLVTGPSPTFWGGYAELGYFLTSGDSRAYDGGAGIFGNTKPARPFGKDGGIGAIQLNLRYDYLDLNDRTIIGGKQNAYIAGLIWTPIQYLRFNLNYAYLQYDDAVTLPNGRTSYGIHSVGSRVELDF